MGAPDEHSGTGGLAMTRPPLAPRSRAVLEAIRSAIERQGYPPTLREIGATVGLSSPSSVTFQLDTLVRKGYIRRDPGAMRAIVLLDA